MIDWVKLDLLSVATGLSHSGKSIWSQEWDVLIVLDACRYDLFKQVEEDYSNLPSAERTTSVASSTTEWLNYHFLESETDLSDVAYISGNPNTVFPFYYEFDECDNCGTDPSLERDDRHHSGTTTCDNCGKPLDGDRRVPVGYLDEVWRDHWNNDLGTIEPRPITDAAIRFARDNNYKQLIIHYMQPHHPFITDPSLDSGSFIAEGDEYREKQSKTVWEQLKAGDLSEDVVREEYRNNLRLVLDELELLLKNIDGEVAITSDHGNAIGEWNIYGHPQEVYLDCLTSVPWVKVTSTDEWTYEPSSEPKVDERDTLEKEGVKQRLADLGYR